ncbi:MAG: four-helix bundle copper-binding protein [Noviherbaspirillum sp.]
MAHPQFQACIDECHRCADACDYCANLSLSEYDIRALKRCIRLTIDCAQLCRVAAAYMARGSELSNILCTACSQVCEVCADECAQHEMQHCQDCASACRRCAEACTQMLTTLVSAASERPGAAMH